MNSKISFEILTFLKANVFKYSSILSALFSNAIKLKFAFSVDLSSDFICPTVDKSVPKSPISTEVLLSSSNESSLIFVNLFLYEKFENSPALKR